MQKNCFTIDCMYQVELETVSELFFVEGKAAMNKNKLAIFKEKMSVMWKLKFLVVQILFSSN